MFYKMISQSLKHFVVYHNNRNVPFIKQNVFLLVLYNVIRMKNYDKKGNFTLILIMGKTKQK